MLAYRVAQGALGAPEEASPPDLTALQLRFARRFYLRLLLGTGLGRCQDGCC